MVWVSVIDLNWSFLGEVNLQKWSHPVTSKWWGGRSRKKLRYSPKKPAKTELEAEIWHPNGGSFGIDPVTQNFRWQKSLCWVCALVNSKPWDSPISHMLGGRWFGKRPFFELSFSTRSFKKKSGYTWKPKTWRVWTLLLIVFAYGFYKKCVWYIRILFWGVFNLTANQPPTSRATVKVHLLKLLHHQNKFPRNLQQDPPNGPLNLTI